MLNPEAFGTNARPDTPDKDEATPIESPPPEPTPELSPASEENPLTHPDHPHTAAVHEALHHAVVHEVHQTLPHHISRERHLDRFPPDIVLALRQAYQALQEPEKYVEHYLDRDFDSLPEVPHEIAAAVLQEWTHRLSPRQLQVLTVQYGEGFSRETPVPLVRVAKELRMDRQTVKDLQKGSLQLLRRTLANHLTKASPAASSPEPELAH